MENRNFVSWASRHYYKLLAGVGIVTFFGTLTITRILTSNSAPEVDPIMTPASATPPPVTELFPSSIPSLEEEKTVPVPATVSTVPSVKKPPVKSDPRMYEVIIGVDPVSTHGNLWPVDTDSEGGAFGTNDPTNIFEGMGNETPQPSAPDAGTDTLGTGPLGGLENIGKSK